MANRRDSYASTRGFYRKAEFYEQLLEKHHFEIIDAVTSGTVISHEFLREVLLKRKDPFADAALLKAVEKTVLLKQSLFYGKKNSHMNWIARRLPK